MIFMGPVSIRTQEKSGMPRILSFSITGLSSRYAFMGENMSLELAGMLKGLIFSPVLSEGKFREEDIRQEKRQICELIDSDMNDKRLYAKRRCEMLLADGENWGLNPYGTKRELKLFHRKSSRKHGNICSELPK